MFISDFADEDFVPGPLQNLIEFLETQFKTGSTVFGIDHEESDIDIVINVDAEHDFIDVGRGHIQRTSEVYDEDGFVCYRVPGTKYNVMKCIEEECYDRWKQATQLMKKCCDRSEAFKQLMRDDKPVRKEVFDEFFNYDGEW